MAKRNERTEEYHEQFAARIIKAFEAGTAPWQKPWRPGERILPHNFSSGRDYRGGNAVYLAMNALDRGYADPRWSGYRQVQEAGGHVRKGEKGTPILYVERRDGVTGERLIVGHEPRHGNVHVSSRIKALENDPKEIRAAAADVHCISDWLMARERERRQSDDRAQPERNDDRAGQTVGRDPDWMPREPEPARLSKSRPPVAPRPPRPPDDAVTPGSETPDRGANGPSC